MSKQILIKKLKVKNFKKFQDDIFEFNDDTTILVGDNDSGKSSILEAIEMCLSNQYRGKPLAAEISVDLFNQRAIETFLTGSKSSDTLPEIVIEAYISGIPHFKGEHNSLDEDVEGITLRICFDKDAENYYKLLLKDPSKITTLPIEFYKVEWCDFGWNKLNQFNKEVKTVFIDPTRLHPTYGKNKYISIIISSSLDKQSRAALNLSYRQLKSSFDKNDDVIAINKKLDGDNTITDKTLKITTDVNSSMNLEANLQFAINEVAFTHTGKGEQNQIQIKLALHNKAAEVDIITIEEPENHLSFMNLAKLINFIETKNTGKQIILTTHSSYVLNKLSLDKLYLIGNGKHKKLNGLNPHTVKMFKRLPGYDTLRIALAKRVILVEGPSDELILKKLYQEKFAKHPEEDGVDVIVVRGLGFRNYINIAQAVETRTAVITDNDGQYQTKIQKLLTEYSNDDFIKFFIPTDDSQYSLEPSLIEANGQTIQTIDTFAKVALSKVTYKEYDKQTTLDDRKKFLRDWYKGDSGKKKVDSAIRLFDEDKIKIEYPQHLHDAIAF